MVVGNAAKVSKGQMLPWEPFWGTKEPTCFEMAFIFQGIRYTYGISFDEKKIYKEYLYHWPNGREALIFSRENGVYEFRENVNEQVTLSNRTPDNKLYLVSSNDWNLPQTENAYRWFLEKLTFLMDEEPATSETVAQIVSGNDKKARILKELLLADLGIIDVTIKNGSGKVPVITTTHRIINEDGTIEYFQTALDSVLIKELIFVTNIIIILAIFLEAKRKHMNFNIASGKQSCQICTQQESIRACYIDVVFSLRVQAVDCQLKLGTHLNLVYKQVVRFAFLIMFFHIGV